MFINKKSPVPAYYQLKNIILKKIRDGEYPEGSIIPSERDLERSLDISRMTVRQALNQLVTEGVLYREKGKGTFVAKGKFEQRNIMSFSETIRKKGMQPHTQVLEFNRDYECFDIKNILTIDAGEALYRIKRLRLANEIPVAIEEVFIPERYCPGLEKFDLNSSFYNLIKEEYSFDITHIDNVIEALKPTKEERELLHISVNTPVLRITGVSYSGEELKLFYERNIYRSDEYSCNMRIFMNKDT